MSLPLIGRMCQPLLEESRATPLKWSSFRRGPGVTSFDLDVVQCLGLEATPISNRGDGIYLFPLVL